MLATGGFQRLSELGAQPGPPSAFMIEVSYDGGRNHWIMFILQLPLVVLLSLRSYPA